MAESGPKFRVLEKVAFGSAPYFVDAGLVGRVGMVVSIRRYSDSTYTYALGSLDDEEVGGLFDEADLVSTGTFGTAEGFGPTGPFRVREIVEVDPAYSADPIGGMRGVVDNLEADFDDNRVTSISIEGLDEEFHIPNEFLRATGERLPAVPLGVAFGSSAVTEDGHLIGTRTFVLIDDIDHYL